MTTIDKALFTNNAAMLLYGLSAVLIGPTLPGMIATMDLTLGQAGFISAMQNAGGFVGAIIALLIADRVSHTTTAYISFALLGVAFITVGVAPDYAIILVTFAFTGLFIRIMDVMLNASTGDFAGFRSGRALSTLHMFFSIGAFVGPVVARGIMGAGTSWSQVFLYSGLGYVAVVVVSMGWLRVYGRIEPVAATATVAEAEDVGPGAAPAALPAVITMGGVLFFYAIHQVGITSWVPYFLETARGAGPNVASFGLSAYWIGIILGRYGSSRLVAGVGAYPLLVGGCVLSALATLGAVLVPQPLVAHVFLVVGGISSGATIPLGYSIGYSFYPTRTGVVTAFMALLMLVGRFLGPWIVGIVADGAGLVIAMTITGGALFFSGALGGVVWVLYRSSVVTQSA